MNLISTAWNMMDHNGLQRVNMIWNLMGVTESDWDRKKMNVLQREGFNMEYD